MTNIEQVGLETVSEGALEPCPWHGDHRDLLMESSGPSCFWIVCNRSSCGCEGPYARTEAEAIAAWNRRSPVLASGLAIQAEAELRAALEFYRDGYTFTTNPRRGGLEWKPTEALLDDCGNTARLALFSAPSPVGGSES